MPVINPDRWHVLQPLLDQALELPDDERVTFLAELRERSPELAAELTALLAAEEAADREQFLAGPLDPEAPNARRAGTELRAHLQSALGDAYAVERELGGGGMSRVFVARERALGRTVVIKVLLPELAAGISAERFAREVRLVAALQHPNVVPLFTAGDAGGLPYYVMPYVRGESLRARLARDGRLPTADALSVLRDVARALAFAHEEGVVHRDVKPENVLLSGDPTTGSGQAAAVVTDFGIAKAVSSAARTTPAPGPRDATLSIIGATIGTPAYIAPEQAAGDPGVDHRADIYAWGIVAYELLAGAHPFAHCTTAQEFLAAHLSEEPAPLARRTPGLSPAVAALVMRCLEKDPARRPQAARELLEALATFAHATELASGLALGRALALYAAAFLSVALLARLAIAAIGLPDWVFPGALIVMALGLPVILVTALVHRQGRAAVRTGRMSTPSVTPPQSSPLAALAARVRPHVTWRRTALGGAAALGVFAAVVAGYMALRALGVGPAGSLLAAGRLEARDRVLVADFRAAGPDTTLGTVVAEAVRANLSQSAVVSIPPASGVIAALGRMQRPATSRLDLELAREVAQREGVTAVVDGAVTPVGAGFIVSLRLVAADSGDVLASFQETAEGPKELIPTIDRLTRKLREKIGESLRAVRATPPLDRVTTPSLEALRKYALGVRLIHSGADWERGVALLEEAIALDTGFAMAYRRLGALLSTHPGQAARAQALIEKAHAHRDRLTAVERGLTVATYYLAGPAPDEDKALAAYEGVLSLQPDNATALHGASRLYELHRRDFARAAELASRGIAADSHFANVYITLATNQIALGRPDEARRTLELAARKTAGHPYIPITRAGLAFSEELYDSAAAVARRDLVNSSAAIAREFGALILGSVASVEGRLGDARRWRHTGGRVQAEGREAWAGLAAEVYDAIDAVWFLGDTTRALRIADAALARFPLDSVARADRPYDNLVRVYTLAGRADRARALLADHDRSLARGMSRLQREIRHAMLADIALAERRFADAIREYREADYGPCPSCALPDLARAYDLSGNADSALAVFVRYLEARPQFERVTTDAWFRAGTHKRVAELYEAKGDRARAAAHYAKFVELWKDADPELQPTVAEVRRRLARLSDVEPR